MVTTFYAAALIAIVATALAISQKNVVHGLLYLIVSLLAVALMFLNLGPRTVDQERRWLPPRAWIGPLTLTLVLLVELIAVLASQGPMTSGLMGDPRQVGIVLFGPYALGVELASLLLLSGLIGAYHLGRREPGRS